MKSNDRLSNAAQIQALNDAFRTSFVGGTVMITAGVDILPTDLKSRVLKKVRDFSDFDENNDPHLEHDFGSFELSDRTFFWKIDYYAHDMEHASEDPSNPTQTVRVLTIMLAKEY